MLLCTPHSVLASSGEAQEAEEETRREYSNYDENQGSYKREALSLRHGPNVERCFQGEVGASPEIVQWFGEYKGK